MNPQNHKNNPDGSGQVPLQRKRGRPRKYPKVEWKENERINENQPGQSEVENRPDDPMVGQAVFGAIEAKCDFGYFIRVRIGNSDAILSGIAYMPAHHVPTGAVGSSSLASSQGKNASSVAEQTTQSLTIGKVVPIVLPPSNLSNDVPINNQPQHMTRAYLRSLSGKQNPKVEKVLPPLRTQPSQVTLPKGELNEDAGHDQSPADELTESEAASMRLPDLPFEKLVTEIVKRIQLPSDSIVTETDNSKSGGKNPVQARPREHSASTTKPLEIRNISDVSEVLQIMQGNTNAEP